MDKKFGRVALFMDYENFLATLQKRVKSARNPYGTLPRIRFDLLVETITTNFGPLDRQDFIVVANFTHYDPQKGGLNQFATLIPAESFEPREVRQQEQSSPGKKHVMEHYSDVRLAFEIGWHAATRPADLYIIASGDKAFAAAGHALKAQGRRVLFLLPEPQTAAVIIKQYFDWIAFDGIQPLEPEETEGAQDLAEAPRRDEVDDLCDAISSLRQEFSTAIPATLLRAIFVPSQTEKLLQKALSQGRIDRWKDPASGQECISRREERMLGKVVPIALRPDFAERARLLCAAALVSDRGLKDASRAGWHRALKEEAGLSSTEAKKLRDALFEMGLLQDGRSQQLHLNLQIAMSFLKKFGI